MEAELLEPRDWQEYREIRLKALADAPDAFSSTLEQERALGEADWRGRLAGPARFVVRQDGQAVGLAGGIVEDGLPHLISMWVDPGWRGRGVADALVQAVLNWARRAGYPAILLWVTVGNLPAQRLYQRHGFRSTGATQPVRPQAPELIEQEMRQRFVTVRAGGPADVDAATQIWAEATAARDGGGEVATIAEARPILLRELARPGAEFTVAVDGGRVVAFATASQAEPGGKPGDGPGVAEVSYVGAAPDRWGEGLAAVALRALARQLAASGYQSAELHVYADNQAARRLYDRLGWVTDGSPPVLHPRTGRPWVRYLLPSLAEPDVAS